MILGFLIFLCLIAAATFMSIRKAHKSYQRKRYVKYTPTTLAGRDTSLGQSDFYIEASGVTKKNDDGSDRQEILKHCRPGEILLLVREAEDFHEDGVIKIIRSNGEQIGVVGKNTADKIAQDMDWGFHFRAEIADITRRKGRKKTLGCNIKVTLV